MATVATRSSFAVPDIQVAGGQAAAPASRSTTRPAPAATSAVPARSTVAPRKPISRPTSRAVPSAAKPAADPASTVASVAAEEVVEKADEVAGEDEFETYDMGLMDVKTGVLQAGKRGVVPKWTNELRCHVAHLTPKDGSGRRIVLCQLDESNSLVTTDDCYAGVDKKQGLYLETKGLEADTRCMMIVAEVKEEEVVLVEEED